MRHWKRMGNWIGKKEPVLLIWIAISCLVTGITPLFGIVIPKLMLDELLGEKNEKKLIILVAALAFGTLLCMWGKAVCKKKTTTRMEHFVMIMEEEMGKKPTSLPMLVSEKKSIMDLHERGKYGLGFLEDWSENIQKIGGGLVTCISSGIIILSNQWYLLLLLLAANIIAMPCMKQLKKLEVDNANRSVPEDREFQYYCSIANDCRFAKDLKMFGGIDFMLTRAKENMDRIIKINHSYFTRSGCFQGIMASVMELETAILFGILGVLLYTGGIQVGMFTMLYSACRQFGQTWNSMVASVNRMVTDGILMEPLWEYLNLEEEEETEDSSEEVERCISQAQQGIFEWKFQNVTFCYPTAKKNSLFRCSFKIRSGETVALVGKNGAGKSTIVKLICRFYKPQEGKILLNGVDIQRIPRKKYCKMISPTFQDFKLLPFSIAENIACKSESDMTCNDKERIEEEAKHLGFYEWVNQLPNKFSTFLSQHLTKEGVLPSGGLAQKIALARSVCHGGGMVIMDEPTAALDPKSEEEIFMEMSGISKNKTCLFISHRLSSTRLADRILVLEDGEMIEEGNHETLMKKKGIYRDLYEIQASQYRDEQ